MIVWLETAGIPAIWEQQIYRNKGTAFNFMFGTPTNLSEVWDFSTEQYYNHCIQCYREIVGNLLDAIARTQ